MGSPLKPSFGTQFWTFFFHDEVERVIQSIHVFICQECMYLRTFCAIFVLIVNNVQFFGTYTHSGLFCCQQLSLLCSTYIVLTSQDWFFHYSCRTDVIRFSPMVKYSGKALTLLNVVKRINPKWKDPKSLLDPTSDLPRVKNGKCCM